MPTQPALISMALGLVFVIVLILACAWAARRFGLLQRGGARLLRQIDHLSLGPRSGITVVEVQDTWLVVGVTAGQITVLHTLPAGTVPTNDNAFPKQLSRILNAAKSADKQTWKWSRSTSSVA